MRALAVTVALGALAAAATGAGPAPGITFETVKIRSDVFVKIDPTTTWIDASSKVAVIITASTQARVYDLGKYGNDPNVKGQGFIDWDWDAVGANKKGTRFRFSKPVMAFSLEAGDWMSDDDEKLSLEAFDCEGRSIDRHAETWAIDRGPPFARLRVKAANAEVPICSAIYRSGGQYAGSTFIDNLRIELSPGPTIAR